MAVVPLSREALTADDATVSVMLKGWGGGVKLEKLYNKKSPKSILLDNNQGIKCTYHGCNHSHLLEDLLVE